MQNNLKYSYANYNKFYNLVLLIAIIRKMRVCTYLSVERGTRIDSVAGSLGCHWQYNFLNNNVGHWVR